VFGAVTPDKAPEECIWSLAMLKQWKQHVDLWFVGGAPPAMRDYLRSIAAKAGVADQVHLFDDLVTEEAYRDFLAATDVSLAFRSYGLGGLSGGLLDSIAGGVRCISNMHLAEAMDAPSFVRRTPDGISAGLLIAENVLDILQTASFVDTPAHETLAYQNEHSFELVFCKTAGKPEFGEPLRSDRAKVGVMIYADVTELASNPIRSGIQRVAREVLAGLSETHDLRACIFSHDRIDLIELPDEAVELLTERDPAIRALHSADIAARIRAILERSPVIPVPHTDVSIVVPELFFDARRAEHYAWRQGLPGSRIAMLFFDFIPWLHPDRIGVERSAHLMPYIKLSLDAQLPAFISSQTYDDWRNPNPARTQPRRCCPTAGSRRAELGEASLRTLETHCRLPWLYRRPQEPGCPGSRVRRRCDEPRTGSRPSSGRLRLRPRQSSGAGNQANFRHLPSRAAHSWRQRHRGARHLARSARHCVFEPGWKGMGYLLLKVSTPGIPVIVAEGIPSIQRLSENGQIRLQSVDEAAIEAALWRIADDEEVARLWSEAATLQLPTWADFGANVQKRLALLINPTEKKQLPGAPRNACAVEQRTWRSGSPRYASAAPQAGRLQRHESAPRSLLYAGVVFKMTIIAFAVSASIRRRCYRRPAEAHRGPWHTSH